MTKSELRQNVMNTGSHHFDRKTMKFFGDTMANYTVRELPDCYALYRKNPVKHGLWSTAYFDKVTFARIYKKEGE